MAQITIEGNVRENAGKGVARKLRAEGRIPGVMYGKGVDPVKLEVDEKNLATLMKKHGLNFIIDLQLGGKNYTCMLADYQRDVFQRHLTHVDFKVISLEDKVVAKVPIHMLGDNEVRGRGGICQLYLRDITLRALPVNIPKFFNLSVGHLHPGQAMKADKLTASGDYEILNSPDQVVVNVLAPRALAAARAAEASTKE